MKFPSYIVYRSCLARHTSQNNHFRAVRDVRLRARCFAEESTCLFRLFWRFVHLVDLLSSGDIWRIGSSLRALHKTSRSTFQNGIKLCSIVYSLSWLSCNENPVFSGLHQASAQMFATHRAWSHSSWNWFRQLQLSATCLSFLHLHGCSGTSKLCAM